MTRIILGYREIQVLRLIHADVADYGRVRTYAGIARALGIKHRSHVADVIRRLERRGLINRVGRWPDWHIQIQSLENRT